MKKAILLTLFAVFLSACSGIPEDKAVETMVRDNLLIDGLGDLFVLQNFKKTNGFRESENVYIVDVEYDLEFRKSFIDVVKEIRADPTGPQYGMFGSKFVMSAIQSNFGQFDKGDKIHKVEKVRLHNTEQGWQLAK
ncbi:MAG: hypothetical protein GY792_03705 [Gammaproteobacteria bacterium]|nr:hypothetical protein [Gammaproteobacteria bacterium]